MMQDNLCVVAGLPEMIADFKEINNSIQPVVYYDTIFFDEGFLCVCPTISARRICWGSCDAIAL